MAQQLTAEDAKQSLTTHVETKGVEVFVKYGPHLGWGELQRLLLDSAYVRYPCEIAFDAAALLPGEAAHPVQKGDRPEDGFTMFVHPLFMLELDRVVFLVLYQLVVVNYGEFASADEAETFGAAALGLTRDEYYSALCEMVEQVGGTPVDMPDVVAADPHGCGGGGCGCGA
jgi:hypothetical protein